MTFKELLSNVEKLGISEELPKDPGLFSLHQKVGDLLDRKCFTRRENNVVVRDINNEFIDPIP